MSAAGPALSRLLWPGAAAQQSAPTRQKRISMALGGFDPTKQWHTSKRTRAVSLTPPLPLMPACPPLPSTWFRSLRKSQQRCGALPVRLGLWPAARSTSGAALLAMQLVVDTGATIDDGLRAIRDYLRSRPLVWRNGQAQLWQKIGLIEVAEVPIVISYDYETFDDYWTSYATGPAEPPSACRKCRPKGETRFAASLVLATSRACQTVQDHSRP